MARVFLGLGANLGDRKRTIACAIAGLGSVGKVTAVSSLYDTAPVGDEAQPRFLNLVAVLETTLSAQDLLKRVKALEVKLGRRPSRHWGPRAIDIDILLYDDALITLPALTVPHPRMCERVFVLAPLAELAPEAVVPGTGRTVGALLRLLPNQGVRRLEGKEGSLPSCTK